jgi:hypothetical protein
MSNEIAEGTRLSDMFNVGMEILRERGLRPTFSDGGGRYDPTVNVNGLFFDEPMLEKVATGLEDHIRVMQIPRTRKILESNLSSCRDFLGQMKEIRAEREKLRSMTAAADNAKSEPAVPHSAPVYAL